MCRLWDHGKITKCYKELLVNKKSLKCEEKDNTVLNYKTYDNFPFFFLLLDGR